MAWSRELSAPGGQDTLPARIYNVNQLNKPLILSGMETRSATLKIRPAARRF
jgi:hypothetical protein